MTLQDAAQHALDIQDAVNLSGVVEGFANVTPIIWEAVRVAGGGPPSVNQHPIAVLFASKIGDLTGLGPGEYGVVTRAYVACWHLVQRE